MQTVLWTWKNGTFCQQHSSRPLPRKGSCRCRCTDKWQSVWHSVSSGLGKATFGHQTKLWQSFDSNETKLWQQWYMLVMIGVRIPWEQADSTWWENFTRRKYEQILWSLRLRLVVQWSSLRAKTGERTMLIAVNIPRSCDTMIILERSLMSKNILRNVFRSVLDLIMPWLHKCKITDVDVAFKSRTL